MTILLASIDRFEPGNTCVESALALRESDFQCVESGRAEICLTMLASKERTADDHDSNEIPIAVAVRSSPCE